MSFAAAFLLAAAAAQVAPAGEPAGLAAQAAPAGEPAGPDRGAQVASARVSVTILRPAVLRNGALVSSGDGASARSQRQSRDGRVTYEFE